MIQVLWKEEKKISNFNVGHFFQFLSLLGEKGKTRLKLHLISDAVKSDLWSVFYLYLELQNSDWDDSCCVGKFTQRSTIFILLLRANSNYSNRYRAWECVKEVSAVRQVHYSATQSTTICWFGPKFNKRDPRAIKSIIKVRKEIPRHSYTLPKIEDFFQRDLRRRFKDSKAQLQHRKIHILPNILFKLTFLMVFCSSVSSSLYSSIVFFSLVMN